MFHIKDRILVHIKVSALGTLFLNNQAAASMPPRLLLPRRLKPSIPTYHTTSQCCPNDCFHLSITALPIRLSSTNWHFAANAVTPRFRSTTSTVETTSTICKVRGDTLPNLEQATPEHYHAILEKRPRAIRGAIREAVAKTAKRPFSTASARRLPELEPSIPGAVSSPAGPPDVAAPTAIVLEDEEIDRLPPLVREETLDGRYPALVEQFVGLIQQDGKKGIAQKVS